MSVTATAFGVNPSGPGLEDGYIVINLVGYSPQDPGDIFYYTINYGDTWEYGAHVNYKVYYDLGAGIYNCLMRINGEFSVPVQITLTDGTPPDPEPDSIVYNTIYAGDFCDKNGDDIFVDIKQRMQYDDPVPDVTPIMFGGEEPVLITHKEPDNYYKQEPINGSECTIKIHAPKDGSFQLSNIYTTDEREWMVVISGSWNWSGFIIPDSCQEPFMPLPYDVEITATDGLGALKDVPFEAIIEGTGINREVNILTNALSQTGLSLKLLTAVNTSEENMDLTGTNKSPLYNSSINITAFRNEDRTWQSSHEVIRSIVERWSCRLRQWNGVWELVNTLEKSEGDVVAMLFNEDGSFNSGTTVGNEITCGSTSDYDVAPTDGTVSIAKAFLASTAYYKYGYLSNELYNGNMDIWLSKPTGLPDGWAVTGGVTAETGTRYEGSIETTDYFIKIHNETATEAYLYNTNTVQIRANSPTTVSFDFYAPTAYQSLPSLPRYIQVVLIDDDGKYYNNDGWQSVYVSYDVKYYSHQMKNQFNCTFELPARDTDWQVQFGIRNMDGESTTRYELQVNNVRVTTAINDAAVKPGIGLINKQVQIAKQTYTKDQILLLHGDEPLDTQRTSQIAVNDAGGGLFGSSSWSRAGYPGENEGLLHIVANSELVNHSRPYRILEANFVNAYKVHLNPNTLLTVDLITGSTFIFLSGKFRLKEGNHQLVFAEALTEAVVIPDDASEEQKEVYE